MQRLLKIVTSWLVVAAGFLLAALALAMLSMVDFASERLPEFLTLLVVLSTGAPVLVVGSSVATKDRFRGGLILRGAIPIGIFLVAGGPIFGLVWTALLFTVRHRRRAAWRLALIVSMVGVVYVVSHGTTDTLRFLGAWSAFFGLFGLFWWGTHKLGWPTLVPSKPRGLRGAVIAVATPCLIVLCLTVAVTFGLSVWWSGAYSGSYRPLIVRPVSPDHAVFTARILLVGRPLKDSTMDDGSPRERRAGTWAIGVVEERFWGLPASARRFVLLTHYVFWKGETYFIDGQRPRGTLRRLLPIIEAPSSRTRVVGAAVVDLRVLREKRNVARTGLVGAVYELGSWSRWLGPTHTGKFVPDARITATGATRTAVATTDRSGFYQIDDLPSGDYTMQVETPSGQIDRSESPHIVHLLERATVEENFMVVWNGQIRGHVEDEAGNPAAVTVKLVDVDHGGESIESYRFAFGGDYQLTKIQPGRYMVVVNPNGPDERAPYDVQNYREVFQIAEGQEITGVNFKVHRLKERTIRVRVIWPDGNAAAIASVCVAYEHTRGYEPLEAHNCPLNSDRNGVALVHLYGDSRVRLFVTQDSRFSRRVEMPAGSVPDKLDFVLDSKKP